jgi:hypothetical protein
MIRVLVVVEAFSFSLLPFSHLFCCGCECGDPVGSWPLGGWEDPEGRGKILTGHEDLLKRGSSRNSGERLLQHPHLMKVIVMGHLALAFVADSLGRHRYSIPLPPGSDDPQGSGPVIRTPSIAIPGAKFLSPIQPSWSSVSCVGENGT